MPSRTLLCYGDSNTHGTRPHTPSGRLERFDWDQRWTGVLARGLGADWRVIEEGLPSRTTVHDDPIDGPPQERPELSATMPAKPATRRCVAVDAGHQRSQGPLLGDTSGYCQRPASAAG
ncbi:hypothetical protein Q3H58_000106 [Pseudomonas psychrotolerans]|nr:hypothetical protein [Pseudomonas psychrotolerans]